MKKLTWAAALLAMAFAVAGCDGRKAPAGEDADTLYADIILVPDTTVYGKCGEGTAMNTLELVTDQNDTIIYSLEKADSAMNIKGGLLVGDRIAVIEGATAGGVRYAEKVINLTSLLGRWVSLDKTFEMQDGGIVISNVHEPKPYVDWKIFNGSLVLSADTFEIYSLGADSLYLENDKGIYSYKRQIGATVTNQ